MSDPNPPEQPSFNQPAGSHPTTPLPTGPSAPTAPSAGSSAGSSAGPSPTPLPTPPSTPGGGTTGTSRIPDAMTEGSGFLSALFDFSFTNFVTPILVRFVYLLATVALVASWLIFVFVGFAQGVGSGLTALILGPIFLVIYLAVIRMTLEFYLSVVRMSEDIHKRLPQA